MTVKNLIATVPPPTTPADAFNGPWGTIETKLGTSLPEDYKDFVRLYGRGLFWQSLSIYTPGSPDEWDNLVSEAYAVQKFFVTHNPGLRMYPQSGGLLACGSTDVGEYIFWLTRGPVDEWPIVVWDRNSFDDNQLEVFECDLTDFIAGIIKGEVRPKSLPDGLELEDGEPLFEPSPVSADD